MIWQKPLSNKDRKIVAGEDKINKISNILYSDDNKVNHLAASAITIAGLLYSGLSHQNQWSQRAKLLNYCQGLNQPPSRSLLQNSQMCFHQCDFHFFPFASFRSFLAFLVQLTLVVLMPTVSNKKKTLVVPNNLPFSPYSACV